ncbi:UBE3C [Bugula neritina]|uniref:HECT-type E3 ubiquitin transferase n=1 Tax=Bugula neritina TaxID=10212 RepID=A0A7J7J426_BUGNE|nr:UBE3C [Bugula neritina]
MTGIIEVTKKKDELLADAQQKRLQREQFRLESKSAVKIQACYRSYRVRKVAFSKERAVFHHCIHDRKSQSLSQEDIIYLFKSLNFFFMKEIDHVAVMSMCTLAVQHQSLFKDYVRMHTFAHHCQFKRWLTHVVGVLEHLAPTSENISMALRVLEIFLDKELFDSESNSDVFTLTDVYRNLVQHGYFQTMRALCDFKIPSGIEKGTTAPTPLSSSLLALVLKPLLYDVSNDETFRLFVLRKFSTSFMNAAYTSPVCNYILPSIKEKCSKEMVNLIHSINLDLESSTFTHSSTLLHSLMVMLEREIGVCDDNMITEYISIITSMFPDLSEKDTLTFDEASSEMEWSEDTQVNDVLSLSQMRAECVRIVNFPSHVNRFLGIVRSRSSDETLLQVARLCHILTSQMGQMVHSNRLLYMMAFDNASIRRIWDECLSISIVNSAGNTVPVMQILARGLGDSLYSAVRGSIDKLMCLLSAFSSLYYHSVLTLHDDDFKSKSSSPQAEASPPSGSSNPFTREEIISMVATLRDACLGIIYLAVPDSKPVFDERRKFLEEIGFKTASNLTISKESYAKQRTAWIYLFKVTSRLTKHLYIRDTRTHFCPKNHWLSKQIAFYASDLKTIYQNHSDVYNKDLLKPGIGDEDDDDGIHLSVTDTRRLIVLTELPFVIPFEERVQIFHNLIEADKENFQSGFDGFGQMSQATIDINIRRDYIYEDAFEKLSTDNESTVKPKIRVNMRNNAGLEEAGIDGGGIFREFLSELLKTGFDPNRGFFKLTSSNDKLLYPNPEAPAVIEGSEKHFFFLGRMLGKALFENMLIELPFAGFFLTKILGKLDSDFHQLSSLDPTLYRSLLFVKNYTGDVTELGLDFSVVNEVLGTTSHVELKPNGKQISVNKNNCIEYVHLMADYKLNKQIRPQCQAFTQGLEDVIKLEWLRMFNQHELNVVISGATSPIDVNDLRVHTQYSGSYSSDHPTILLFWEVVNKFTPAQRSSLLNFAMSYMWIAVSSCDVFYFRIYILHFVCIMEVKRIGCLLQAPV